MAIFDSLKKTAGQVAKKTGEVANKAGDKAKVMAEISKVKTSIMKVEKEINSTYSELGKAYFEQQKDNAQCVNIELVEKIKAAMATIEGLKEQIEELKSKSNVSEDELEQEAEEDSSEE